MCYGLVSSFTYFGGFFDAEECNKCLVIKITNILFDYNIV